MSRLDDQTGALHGETAYEWFTGGVTSIAYQRDCEHCDKGLIYAPVRFCTRCGGDGYLLRFDTNSGEVTDERG